METFPQIGVELSPFAVMNYADPIVSAKLVYERPGFINVYETGFEESRTFGDTGRFKIIPVHIGCNQTDFNTIFAFLQARDFFNEPFNLVHPYIGTGVVKYAGCDGGPE